MGDGNWFVRLDRNVLKPLFTRKRQPGTPAHHDGGSSGHDEQAAHEETHSVSNQSRGLEPEEQVIELNTISVTSE